MTPRKTAAPKREKGAYHHGDLKTALKSAALKLVLEKGPRGFSINEASRLAGVTVAAPYRHFADKEALLAEIAAEGFRQLATSVRRASEMKRRPEERLRAAGLAYLEFAKQHRGFFTVMFSAGLDKTKYPDMHLASNEAFGTILSLVAAVESNERLALQRAVAAWALVHGLASLDADGTLTSHAAGALRIDPQAVLGEFIIALSASK